MIVARMTVKVEEVIGLVGGVAGPHLRHLESAGEGEEGEKRNTEGTETTTIEVTVASESMRVEATTDNVMRGESRHRVVDAGRDHQKTAEADTTDMVEAD